MARPRGRGRGQGLLGLVVSPALHPSLGSTSHHGWTASENCPGQALPEEAAGHHEVSGVKVGRRSRTALSRTAELRLAAGDSPRGCRLQNAVVGTGYVPSVVWAAVWSAQTPIHPQSPGGCQLLLWGASHHPQERLTVPPPLELQSAFLPTCVCACFVCFLEQAVIS